MNRIHNIALALAAGILLTGAVSCGSKADTKVWTVDQQLHTTDGIYRINGVCYHPVAIGDSVRSFSTLSQDLGLMNELGVNTIRVYEPIDSKEVLDEISEAGVRVIMGFGYNQSGTLTFVQERSLNMSRSSKTIPLFWFGNWATNTISTPSGSQVTSKRGTMLCQLPLMPFTRKTQIIR